jgi:hypothetical protein
MLARTSEISKRFRLKKKRKNFNEQFLKTLKGQPVVSTRNCFLLSDCPIKKSNFKIVETNINIPKIKIEMQAVFLLYNNFGGERKMEKFLIYFFAGFIGGVIRGLVGFVKNKTLEKANHFKPQYFLITVLISGIVGAAAGILADTEWQVSFLAGYAGTDFIENLYKIKFGQRLSSFKL